MLNPNSKKSTRISVPRKQPTAEGERLQMPSPYSGLVFVGKLLFVALFALIIANAVTRTIVFTPVDGNSMQPTYHPAQMLVTYTKKAPVSYERGDIVVCWVTRTDSSGEPNRHPIIKRVIGLPGDVITYDSDLHTMTVNGNPLDESYIAQDAKDSGFVWELGEYSVPAGHIFVMGDNRNHSYDSRKCGAIAYNDIFGYVLGT